MSEMVTDLLETETLSQQPCGAGMAQRVRPVPKTGDPEGSETAVDNVV
jgi:hypothetical protein